MANKPVNLTQSTAHAQHAELQALFGKTTVTDNAAALETALRAANEQLDSVTAELAAEKEAHEKTSAALAAATETPAQ